VSLPFPPEGPEQPGVDARQEQPEHGRAEHESAEDLADDAKCAKTLEEIPKPCANVRSETIAKKILVSSKSLRLMGAAIAPNPPALAIHPENNPDPTLAALPLHNGAVEVRDDREP
jgi:hypothetical protein